MSANSMVGLTIIVLACLPLAYMAVETFLEFFWYDSGRYHRRKSRQELKLKQQSCPVCNGSGSVLLEEPYRDKWSIFLHDWCRPHQDRWEHIQDLECLTGIIGKRATRQDAMDSLIKKIEES